MTDIEDTQEIPVTKRNWMQPGSWRDEAPTQVIPVVTTTTPAPVAMKRGPFTMAAGWFAYHTGITIPLMLLGFTNPDFWVAGAISLMVPCCLIAMGLCAYAGDIPTNTPIEIRRSGEQS